MKTTRLMKYVFLAALLLHINFSLFAQDSTVSKEKKTGFKKENLFTGGGVNLSFFNGTTVIGVSPHFGYSINRWLDAGVSFNFNYISQRDNLEYGDKVRQTTMGPGTFLRVFPVRFLFAIAQYEHNFIRQKYIPAPNGSYLPGTFKYDVNSLLLGAGYASDREPGENTFYYLSVLFDVLDQPGSPYLDNLQRTFPVIRAGFNIALFQGGKHFRRHN